jgi:two-component system cell cycle response regulator DivK
MGVAMAEGLSHGRGSAVLVVEDNEKSLKLVIDLLRFSGYEAVPACTGGEALQLAREREFDLVLMDVQLPDMDGAAALAALRADSRCAQTPVVAVTAFAMKGDRERLLGQGFDGYVSKPIDVATFVGTVAGLVQVAQ